MRAMSQKQNFKQGVALLALVMLSTSVISPLATAATNTSNNSATAITGSPDGSFNFTVSPPAVAVEAQPGVPTTVNIRVQNQGIATEKVNATIMKFDAKGETGLPNLKPLTASDDFGTWAQLSPTTFTAEPNVWTNVQLSISPPKTAAYGYYYAIVFSRANSSSNTQAGKTNLLASIASLVLLDVNAPGSIRKIQVDNFSTTRNSNEFLPVNFNVRLRNVGNTHAGVRGTITISKHNKVIDEVAVNSSNGYVLPQSYRTFTTKWEDGSPLYKTKTDTSGKPILDANGQPMSELSWNNFNLSKLRFGKYDARLVMIYNDGHGDVSTIAKLSFWVIPWRIILPVIVAGLLLLAGVWAIAVRPLYRRFSTKRNHADTRR
jgi:hypothetical protein